MGPFHKKFHTLMDNLALKRVVYHSGTLIISNDVRKTLRIRSSKHPLKKTIDCDHFIMDDA